MASEELENSLRTEVDGYVSSRLTGVLEEVSRLQSQTNEMYTRFMERLGDEMHQNAPIHTAISEHLRAAHKRGIEEAAAESTGTKASSDVAILKAAIEEIVGQDSQANILTALVNRAASFAPRVAFFVVKNDHAIGWRARGLEGSIGDDSVREIALPLAAKTLLGDTVQLRTTWSGEPGANADDRLLLDKLGDEAPQRMVAVPLVARNKAAAVLYADSAKLGPEAINLEALEALVRVSGMAVELLATKRPARAGAEVSAPAPVPPAAATAPAAVPTPPPTPATPAPTSQRAEAPPAPAFVAAPEPVIAEPPPPPPPPPAFKPKAAEPKIAPPPVESIPTGPLPSVALEDVAANGERTAAPVPTITPDPSWTESQKVSTAPLEEGASAQPETPVAATPPPSASVPSQPTAATTLTPEAVAPASSGAPLGSARQYGRGAEVELPIEVSESEKRLHIDARRFARLLVSEIKLYNEEKVQKGRGAGDLYDRLREEIDRSRMMYEKRVSPNVASRYDYFHQELINTLAEGNADKLGGTYPGASLSN